MPFSCLVKSLVEWVDLMGDLSLGSWNQGS